MSFIQGFQERFSLWGPRQASTLCTDAPWKGLRLILWPMQLQLKKHKATPMKASKDFTLLKYSRGWLLIDFCKSPAISLVTFIDNVLTQSFEKVDIGTSTFLIHLSA